ncbi:DUF1272 domain-containing protein, partial [Pantoea vagans]
FAHVCPNCGGELVRRPVRPVEKLQKYPAKMRSRSQMTTNTSEAE